jgi:hypothetical protein
MTLKILSRDFGNLKIKFLDFGPQKYLLLILEIQLIRFIFCKQSVVSISFVSAMSLQLYKTLIKRVLNFFDSFLIVNDYRLNVDLLLESFFLLKVDDLVILVLPINELLLLLELLTLLFQIAKQIIQLCFIGLILFMET